jgi:hypothetical protein
VLLLLDGGHKPIPATVECLDTPLRLSAIANRPAHRHQAGIQGPIPNELLGPQLRQQFVL